MPINTLLQVKKLAKQIKDDKQLSHAQCLNIVAKENGFKTYDALKSDIESKYINVDCDVLKEIKQSIVANHKYIRTAFKQMPKCGDQIKLCRDSEDDDKADELVEKSDAIAMQIIKKIVPNWIRWTRGDTQLESYESYAVYLYTNASDNEFHNDIDGHHAEYALTFNPKFENFEFHKRLFEDIEYDAVDKNGNDITIVSKIKTEWVEDCTFDLI